MNENDLDVSERLLAKVQAGDPRAFEELFSQHRAYLRQVVEVRLDPRLRSRIDPSDIVQETQLEAFRRLKDYLNRRPMPFQLWLRKTAQEQLLVARRRNLDAARRSVGREVALPDHSSLLLAQQLLAKEPTPSEELVQAERAGRVRQAVEQLPEADREILFMRTYEGLAYEEIGYLLEIEPAAARKRHGRALFRLHKVLSELGLSEFKP